MREKIINLMFLLKSLQLKKLKNKKQHKNKEKG